MKQQPAAMIGPYVEGSEYDKLHALGHEFVSACMTNHVVLSAQEQKTLFGLLQRIEQINWMHGIYSAPPTDPKPVVSSTKLNALLNSIKSPKVDAK